MQVSTAALLTRQFYEWELRGRGHTVVDFPAELEPPFIPFFGHFVDAPYVNDGRVHTTLSRIRGLFVPEHTVTVPETPKQEAVAFPDSDEFPDLTIYVVTLPKNYACKADSMEQCLTMLALCRETVSFEIVATTAEITVQIVCRDTSAPFVHTHLGAYFQDCAIRETSTDDVLLLAEGAQAGHMVDFGLQEEFMRPMALLGSGTHDPYVPLFGTLERLRENEAMILQVLFCGTQNAWPESVIAAVTDDRGSSFFADAPEMPNLAREKVSRPLLGATVRMAAFADYADDAARLLQHGALALMNASASHFNALAALSDAEYTIRQRLCDLVLRQTHRVGMLLNTRELATLVHFPNVQMSKRLLNGSRTTKQAPSFLVGQPYVLGTNEHQGRTSEVGISEEQRLKHIHLLGGSGQGKSTLLHSLICQDMESGTGLCVLDPHGDLIDTVLRSVPAGRIDDVILIDPSDGDFPVGFNILSAHSDLERELLSSDLVALFRRFSTSWGDQLHSVLANAIMAFLYNSELGHIGDLRKFLIDPKFRSGILRTCTDSELVYYWQKEYPLLRTSSIGSILTRLDSFLRPKAIRSMVCQHRGLDFPALMDGGKIVLVKLSHGLIGAENSHLLGAVIVAKLQQAAMSRQQQAQFLRRPFFCYVDEFHHFITPSMSAILSGARKYGLGLILAHQDMQQVQRHDGDVSSSLMSNAGTRICFRLSDTDAKRMQDGFSGFSADDLQNLSVGEAVARVNTADADFSLSVIPSAVDGDSHVEEIIAASRAKYGVAALHPAPSLQEQEPPKEHMACETEEKQPTPRAPNPKEPAQRQEPSRRTVQEHRYTQSFIKAMAEQHGYKASIEVPTSDGKGQVDVAIEKDGKRTAFEVSVSTGAEWELHNVQKCLADGYEKVVVCSSDPKKLMQIGKKIQEALAADEQSRVQLVAPEEVSSLFAGDGQGKGAVATMKGYRVKVEYGQSGGTDASDILKRIIGNARK